jgi:hypothetical protein
VLGPAPRTHPSIVIEPPRRPSPSVWLRGDSFRSQVTDNAEEFSGAAGYIDRILKGAKPAGLPISDGLALVVRRQNARIARTGRNHVKLWTIPGNRCICTMGLGSTMERNPVEEEEDGRVVARRIFNALCALYPDRYLMLVQPREAVSDPPPAPALTALENPSAP